MCLNLHLNHLQGSSENATEDIRVPKLVLSAAVIRKLDEIGEGVFFEDERELLRVARPVCYSWCYVEEDFESYLDDINMAGFG